MYRCCVWISSVGSIQLPGATTMDFGMLCAYNASIDISHTDIVSLATTHWHCIRCTHTLTLCPLHPQVVKKTDVGWLDWRMGGPGNGQYQMYVRAVDPAGNRDERFLLESNVYEWYYLSPTPWDIIAIGIAVTRQLTLYYISYASN